MNLETYLKEVKQRVDGATEGPWDYRLDKHLPEANRAYGGPCGYSLIDNNTLQTEDQRFKNRCFLGHARTDVPVLLEMLTIAKQDLTSITNISKDKCENLAQASLDEINTLIPGGEHEG